MNKMAGMDVSSIKKVKVSKEWMEEEFNDMINLLNLKHDDLIEIKIIIDKVDGNPIEWLQKKYLDK